MYSFIDQPRSRLVAGSCFMLEAMRAWSAFAEQHCCPLLSLAGSFSRAALRETLEPFHAVMLTLHREGRYRLAFGVNYEDRITEGEALLLALWADVVGGNLHRVRTVMELLLAEPAIEPCIASMVRVAMGMAPLGLEPSGLAGTLPTAASHRAGRSDRN